MDGNKDEAERCIEIAESHLSVGNHEKAEKFLLKAEKLYSTKKAKDILESLVRLKASSGSTKKSETDGQPRKRPNAATSEKIQQEKTTAPKEYTQVQLEEVRKINKCKDYYEILSVTKESTDGDIKKAYKKLALRLHPDKNKAPGANEAFKAIGKAVTVLTDAEKRKTYDLYGDTEDRVSRHSSQSHATGTAHYREFGFESNLTPEDIFNMFFPTYGNHPYQRRTFQRTYTSRTQESAGTHSTESSSSIIIQIIPIIILILISMMSSLFISEPAYNLQQTSKYSVPRTTNKLNVNYFVKESFHSDYQGSMYRLELSVEEDYINNLRNLCYREKNHRDTLLWKARSFGDSNLHEQAKNMKMRSCEEFKDISARM